MSIDKDLLDRLMEGRSPGDLFGKTGILAELTKALAERALSTEMDVHLDEERAEQAPEGQNQPPNRRNGRSQKTVTTDSGKVVLDIPRDRNGTFDPKLIGKYQRRFPGFDDKVISMYARCMSTREIQGHLAELYGLDVSPDLISTVTDSVQGEIVEWQNRPLERLYPLVFFDALRVKIRDEGSVKNEAIYCIVSEMISDFTGFDAMSIYCAHIRAQNCKYAPHPIRCRHFARNARICPRRARGWAQGNSRAVDRAKRRGKILAWRHERDPPARD